MEDKTFEDWYNSHHNELAGMTHRERALATFLKGAEVGMARSRNYAANSAYMPSQVTFANGRTVRLGGTREEVYLEVLDFAAVLPMTCQYCGDRAYELACSGENSGGVHLILNRP